MGSLINLEGKKFGNWTILQRMENDKHCKAQWKCRCDCGTVRIVGGSVLATGKTKHCGCLNKEKDISGEVYGTRTIISMEPNYRVRWKCSCGKEGISEKRAVIGRSKSCGCLNLEKIRNAILLPDNLALKNAVYDNIRRSSVQRGYEFNFSFEEFLALSQKPCYYCGAEPANETKDDRGREVRIWRYQGLDRVDNLKGYESINVIPCCITCNKAKLAMSQEEFLLWIARVHNYTAKNREFVNSIKINVQVIPHSEQGPSKICAQWNWDKNGVAQVFISRLGNLDMERVITAHEIMEILSSAHFPGMDDANTDKIDAEFLEKRNSGALLPDEIEPGFWYKSPYRWPHTLSTGIELILAAWLKVDWLEYQRRLDEVSFARKEFDF